MLNSAIIGSKDVSFFMKINFFQVEVFKQNSVSRQIQKSSQNLDFERLMGRMHPPRHSLNPPQRYGSFQFIPGHRWSQETWCHKYYYEKVHQVVK